METMAMTMAIMITPIATAIITMATKVAVVGGLIIGAGLNIVAQIVLLAGLVLVAPKNKLCQRSGLERALPLLSPTTH